MDASASQTGLVELRSEPCGLGHTATIPSAVPVSDFKEFEGNFVIYRKTPQGFRKRVGGLPLPKVRHQTYELAQEEAFRLWSLYPESTFVIMREMARIKARAALAGGQS